MSEIVATNPESQAEKTSVSDGVSKENEDHEIVSFEPAAKSS
jgi:hypothetical protein